MRTALPLALAMGILAALPAGGALAKEAPVYTGTFSNLAVSGYDAVAYHTLGRPTKGSKDFTHSWMGAEWRFATAENRDLFAAAPERYAPQFGGYCAWAVSQGYTASADPEAWRIVDGKLYLNYNQEIQKRWETDVPKHVSAGHANWPAVLDK
ncbi:MAG TPA: YHS domain-containing (seleno)protein [Azospirillaceae bacterium]|nr:YHS domain-containing (seleno)protein [Azospirillaceae bacterium]